MAPSRTKASRKARRVRRVALQLQAEVDFAAESDAYTAEDRTRLAKRLATALAAVEKLPLLGWEGTAEGFQAGDDEGEAPAPKVEKTRKVKATAKAA